MVGPSGEQVGVVPISTALRLAADADLDLVGEMIERATVAIVEVHFYLVADRSFGDQPPGGGNLFAFRLADRSVTCDWTAMDSWKGM